MQKDLKALLRDKKFHFAPDFTGVLQRFDRNGKVGSAWAVGKTYQVGKKTAQALYFGDFATGEKHHWWSTQDITEAERLDLEAAVDIERARATDEKHTKQKATALRAGVIWNELEELTVAHPPYLATKGLTDLYGTRGDERGNLFVPLRDAKGKLWNLQRIGPDGTKRFLPGGKIRGLFFVIGDRELPKQLEEIYVCEGFATGATVHAALLGRDAAQAYAYDSGDTVGGDRIGEETGETRPEDRGHLPPSRPESTSTLPKTNGGHSKPCRVVIVAFNSGNLEPCAKALRERYPLAPITICGDDDRFTTDASGEPFNPGREAALTAASAARGRILLPRFGDVLPGTRPTDFNDMAALYGLEAVSQVLTDARALPVAILEPQIPPVNVQAPQTLGIDESEKVEEPRPEVQGHLEVDNPTNEDEGVTARGKPTRFSEKAVAEKLIEAYQGRLLRQEKSLFLYDGKKWGELNLLATDRIKNVINEMCHNTLDSKKVTSAFNTFFRYVPGVPEGVNLFNPNPTCVNFNNGTLHIRQSADHFYRLEFSAHRPEDYVTNLLPYDYDLNLTAKNQALLDMLDRCFAGTPDKDDRIRAIRQMFGACLVPFRPHLFMLHGATRTGKSTVIQLAEKLVCPENLCSVEPHEFNGFNMESMVGKLVNSDTDITTTAPISEAQIKKIIDRRQARIRRKGIADMYGWLPGIHIFGGNGIPPTLSGTHRAHDARWTFIEFPNRQVKDGIEHDLEFFLWVWEQSPQGVLNFAVEGLKDLLLHRGHYLNPQSGKDTMEEWQLEHDPVGQFLGAIDRNEILDNNTQVIRDETQKIKTTELFKIFKEWCEKHSPSERFMSSIVFHRAMGAKKYVKRPVDGVWYFYGLGSGPRSGGAF